MRTEGRSSTLLTELLIVVMFFLLSMTVLVQVFAAARRESTKAEQTAVAVAEAQNVADRLYRTDDPETGLRELGFKPGDDGWQRESDLFILQVTSHIEGEGAGALRVQQVTALSQEGETLVTLPCSRWIGGEDGA